MTARGIRVSPSVVWAALWALWLGTSLALPVPPWRAREVHRQEEQTALSLALPEAAGAWAMDVGSPRQSRALGAGWSVNEAFVDEGRRRTFAWIEGVTADVAFGAPPRWGPAKLTVRASPLAELAPLAVDVELDGERRGSLLLEAGWSVVSTDIGTVGPGVHLLTLRPRRQATPAGEARVLSLAVDGIAVGPVAVTEPDRDRGVFVGTLDVGLEDRAALFVSGDARSRALPPGSARRQGSDGLVAWYGFGIGDAGRRGSGLIAAVHGLAAAALVILVPGLCWSGLLGWRGFPRIALALASSTAALVAGFVALRVMGHPPEALPTAAVLAVLGGAPLLVVRGRGSVTVPWMSLLLGATSAAVLVWFAVAIVPPLEDQDMEMQATAHALATRQVPRALTNRGTAHYFAHPPLLHLWQAGTFALSGRLSRVAYHDDAGRRAALTPFVEPRADAALRRRPHYEEWKGPLRRFVAEPQLWPGRQVNVLSTALAAVLLAAVAASLASSPAVGLALAVLFVTFPQTLVRGAYGGYFAGSLLLSVVVLGCLHASRGESLSSALAFLADQKGLLVPAAWALVGPSPPAWRRFVPLAGALLAAAAYVGYGLAIDAPTFLFDFLKEHVARRLSGSGLRFASEAGRFYPSIGEVWMEFLGHFGTVFTAWAAVAAVAGLRRADPTTRAAAAAVLVGALVFSATDWRQTKHLALLTGPAVVAIAGTWPASPPGRKVALVLAAACAVRNLWAAWPLLASFESLRPRAGW